MNPTKLFPLVVTDKFEQTKAYYLRAGFTVTIETEGYIQVRYGDDVAGPELAFMRSGEQNPPGTQEPFGGRGLIISVPTADADAKYAQLRERDTPLASAPSDKPWGWRSFAAPDPNGVILDFFHVSAQSAAADATG